MDTREAADRWVKVWTLSWPAKDVEAIVGLQAENGDHWASMFRPFRGRAGLRRYVQDCFDDETRPAEVWFGRPQVDGDQAVVEYWAITYPKDEPLTICGCTLLRFDDEGLVARAHDYSHVKPGRFDPPPGLFN